MYGDILITQLNDFIFCPASIYFHNLYGETERFLYQSESQINGTAAHSAIDQHTYSDRKNIYCAMDVYSEKYGLRGKIDIYDAGSGTLIERKNKIKSIYDGYVFQLYGQCMALREMGFSVSHLVIRSISDNKNYPIPLPEDNPEMYVQFENIINEMHEFRLESYKQTNALKCRNCVYEPACDRGLV